MTNTLHIHIYTQSRLHVQIYLNIFMLFYFLNAFLIIFYANRMGVNVKILLFWFKYLTNQCLKKSYLFPPSHSLKLSYKIHLVFLVYINTKKKKILAQTQINCKNIYKICDSFYLQKTTSYLHKLLHRTSIMSYEYISTV